jgi:hypothetical protein
MENSVTSNILSDYSLNVSVNNKPDVLHSIATKVYKINASELTFEQPTEDHLSFAYNSKWVKKLIYGPNSTIISQRYTNTSSSKWNEKMTFEMIDSLYLEYKIGDDTYEPIYMFIYFEDLTGFDDSYKLLYKKWPKYTGISINIYYNKSNIAHLETITKFTKEINKNRSLLNSSAEDKAYINLVVQENNQIKLREYNIKTPEMNLELNYGIGFSNLYPKMINDMCEDDKGLWIFNSNPGMGKSMVIRKIIAEVNNIMCKNESFSAKVIYLPSEMVKLLEDPSFIPFISKYPGSLLVIEDADVALQSREQYGHIVQTVLNLTDGILSDCLRIKILCTFNCSLDKIDKALLRKGRLTLRHEFEELSEESAIKLAKHLKKDVTKIVGKRTWTLTDIYNIDQDPTPLINKNKGKIGF